jgi:hypothetical protein
MAIFAFRNGSAGRVNARIANHGRVRPAAPDRAVARRALGSRAGIPGLSPSGFHPSRKTSRHNVPLAGGSRSRVSACAVAMLTLLRLPLLTGLGAGEWPLLRSGSYACMHKVGGLRPPGRQDRGEQKRWPSGDPCVLGLPCTMSGVFGLDGQPPAHWRGPSRLCAAT